MKLIYISGACSEETLTEYSKKYNMSSIFVQQKWDYDLAKGLRKVLGDDLFCLSDPPVASYPNGKCIYFKKHEMDTDAGKILMPGIINLPIFKQLHLLFKTHRFIKKIHRKFPNERICVLTGAVIAQYTLAAFWARKMKKCHKVFSVMPDVPGLVVVKAKRLSGLINISTNISKALAMKYDGYICFAAEQMKYLNMSKPSTVVEGLIDSEYIDSIESANISSDKKIVIYAGQLVSQYGVELLIEAFSDLRLKDYELWLFGKGPCVESIKQCGRENIVYKGLCERKTLISFEKSAYLLINARPCELEFSRCSFPSKLIEYMMTGTPVLTSKIAGITPEYAKNLLLLDHVSKDGIISAVLNTENKPIEKLGIAAKNFIRSEKSVSVQAKKMVEFISKEKEN